MDGWPYRSLACNEEREVLAAALPVGWGGFRGGLLAVEACSCECYDPVRKEHGGLKKEEEAQVAVGFVHSSNLVILTSLFAPICPPACQLACLHTSSLSSFEPERAALCRRPAFHWLASAFTALLLLRIRAGDAAALFSRLPILLLPPLLNPRALIPLARRFLVESMEEEFAGIVGVNSVLWCIVLVCGCAGVADRQAGAGNKQSSPAGQGNKQQKVLLRRVGVAHCLSAWRSWSEEGVHLGSIQAACGQQPMPALSDTLSSSFTSSSLPPLPWYPPSHFISPTLPCPALLYPTLHQPHLLHAGLDHAAPTVVPIHLAVSPVCFHRPLSGCEAPGGRQGCTKVGGGQAAAVAGG